MVSFNGFLKSMQKFLNFLKPVKFVFLKSVFLDPFKNILLRSPIWFKFKEGFNNAVRKDVTFSDLL